MLLKFKVFLVGMFLLSTSYAQETNLMDVDGQRHGNWQKIYEGTKQLRYSGSFDHGNEVGEFKFYDKAGGHPTAIKKYTTGSVHFDVSFYTTDGKKVSQGQMQDRSREGIWMYYHSDGKTVLSTETYVNDLKEGLRTEYFINNDKALEANYISGKREGLSTHYTDDGKILKELTYKNDFLHGSAKLYDAFGNLIKEGSYKDNKKHGTWKYYENGKVIKEVKFPQNKIGVEH